MQKKAKFLVQSHVLLNEVSAFLVDVCGVSEFAFGHHTLIILLNSSSRELLPS